MIDFKNAEFLKLKPVDNSTYASTIQPMFIAGEEIIASFKTIRDGVVFTTKRIFAINIQGITGKKVDYTSLPYSKIQAFSVRLVSLIWTANWNFGFPGWVRLNLISSVKLTSAGSAK